jgi:5'-deoxynucleotidase YfbR-like HD superfamily hydrolase
MLDPIRSLPAALLCSVTLALAAGCNTPGHTRAVKTADRLDNLSAALQELQGYVTATSTTLSTLLTQKDQDPAPTFHQFESAVSGLERAWKRAEGHLNGVRAEAEAYFTKWKEQAATINDEDLKERSEERRTELAAAVEKVKKAMEPAHEKIETYVASLHDTLKYLSIDLSPQGIASIDGRAKAAGKSSKAVNEILGEALETVKGVAPQFAQARSTSAATKSAVNDKPAD